MEDGPFASDTVTNTYANRMRMGLALSQPAGFWTNGFAYDQVQRLRNVTMSAGSFGYSYWASPLPATTTLPYKILQPNGAYVTNTYDASGRLTETYLKNSGNSVLDSYAYTYNQANQRTQLTRADSSTVGFTFDNMGQLTYANDSAGVSTRGYGYDAAWNLATRTNYWTIGGTESLTNNNLNEITGLTGELWQYDANGNVTTDDGVNILFQYDYDDENRLTSMEYDDFGSPYYQLSQLAYDGLGRLRQTVEYSWDGSEWVPSVAKNYIYDGMRVIQERDSNNVPLITYTWGRDLSGSFEGAGGIGGLLARSDGYDGNGNWTSNEFYFADGNGNITYLAAEDQGLAASYRYDPFGQILAESGPLSFENSYRFSSKEMFGKNLEWYGAIYNFGYRFYDPNWQRWLNRDPIAADPSALGLSPRSAAVAMHYAPLEARHAPWPGSLAFPADWRQLALNPYDYSANSPVTFVDPLGLWTITLGYSFSAGLGLGFQVGFDFGIGSDGVGFDLNAGGLYVGGGLSSSGVLKVSNAKCLKRTFGKGYEKGMSLGEAAVVGGGAWGGQGYACLYGQAGAGAGFPAEVHNFRTYSTGWVGGD